MNLFTEEEIFAAAIQKPLAERAEFLDRACAGDVTVRSQVEALLAAHDKPDSFLKIPAEAVATIEHVPAERPGLRIGRYKLMEQIGEGGMGTVWVAEQTDPVKRRVALKLIKPGMDSRQVLSRFEAERQALALMDHPNIAKVFDGGMSDTGRPFFVMEYVKGVPITEYCDSVRLSIQQRLKLFVQVCQAVQHAHQKGIIHRDLKPSNILVCLYDGQPVPKLLDFGLAKAMHQPLTEHTLYTAHGLMVGTPLYMSPEQAEFNNLDVDTRSDIYSLGVILYELLTGATPLEKQQFKDAALQEILRLIKEVEPQRPSLRISTSLSLPSIAAQRSLEPAQLSRAVRGDLDWIVMKALEKDRSRRYETANGLARDIDRYLHDEPVEACPPSVSYRLRKFARRNKRALATATLLAVILLTAVGAVAASIGWATRDRAARHAAITVEVDLALKEAVRLQGQGKYADALSAAKRADGLLVGGAVSADLRELVRDRLDDLNMVERLEEIPLLMTQTAEVGKQFSFVAGDDAYRVAFRQYGVDVESLDVQEAANRIRARSIPVELATALDEWARVRRNTPQSDSTSWKHLLAVAKAADPQSWRQQLWDVLESKEDAKVRARMEALADSDQVATLPPVALYQLANALKDAGAVEQALALLRKARQQHPSDFAINQSLADFLHLDKQPPDLDEALRFSTAAVALRPQRPGAQLMLANILARKGKLEEAIAAYYESLRLKPDYFPAHYNLGNTLARQGKLDEAIDSFRKTIELAPRHADAHNNLGNTMARQGKLEEAQASFKRALELNPKTAGVQYNLGYILHIQGKLDEANAWYRTAIEIDPKNTQAHTNLGVVLAAQGNVDEAIACWTKAIKIDPKFANAHYNLGNSLKSQGKLDEAIARYKQAIENDPKMVSAHSNLGLALNSQRKVDEAIACYKKAIELDPKHASSHTNLGTALSSQGKLDEAIACFRTAVELVPKFAPAHANLGMALASQGKLDEAIVCFHTAIELAPKLAGAHSSLALALARQGKMDEAVASFREAIELEPNRAPTHSNLGNALYSQGMTDEAITCWRKAVELDPKFVVAYASLGSILSKKGDLPGSIAAWQQAIALQPDNAQYCNNLARLLAICPDPLLRNPSEAVRLAKRAVERLPKDGALWNTLGAAQYSAGDWQAARVALEKSMELRKGGDGSDRFFLAMAHWQLGDKDQARRLYQQAVEWMQKSKPQDEELRRFRAEAAELLELNEQAKK